MLINVAGKELAESIRMVSALNADTICFTTKNNKLYVTASKASQYVNVLDIDSSSDYINTTMNVLNFDISSIIPKKESITLEFNPVSVTVKTGNLTLPLPVSQEIVPEIQIPSEEPEDIKYKDDLRFSLNMFRATSMFQKVLQSEKPLQLCGDFSVMQFPTVWFRKRSSSIKSTLTKEQALSVLKFNPDKFLQTDRIYLYKDSAVLILTVSPIPIEDEFLGLMERTVSMGKRYVHDFYEHVQELYKVVGVADCSVYVTKSSFFINIRKDSLQIKDTITEEILASFDTRLEYLECVLKLFSNSDFIEFLVTDSIVAFRDNLTAVILSVGGVSNV